MVRGHPEQVTANGELDQPVVPVVVSRRGQEKKADSRNETHDAAGHKQLKEKQKTFQQRIQQREKDVQQLRETVESHKRSAQTAVEDSERIFTELIRSIERSRSELIRLIRDQEKAAVSRAEGRLERLEQEINDLRRRDAELEQLSHTQDHIQFLQSFQSLSAPPESTDKNDDPLISLISSDDLRESVHQLRDKLEDFCKEELKKISDRVPFINIVPRTRNDFLQYSHQLTLDLNTVNKRLRLSESNRLGCGAKGKTMDCGAVEGLDHGVEVDLVHGETKKETRAEPEVRVEPAERIARHPLHGHCECALCLGTAHAEATLNETECPHCEDMSLASLRSWVALFSEHDPAPRALPLSSFQEPVRKKQRERGPQRSAASELTPAQSPRASLSPHRSFTSPLLAPLGSCERPGLVWWKR
ncbi:hypothetical protein Q8A67_009579 [Cirrhinus molitorella]|uniref:TRIM8/14/16/25/29/45/65 coiled-coil region domain-containing protein n=1 Tax=Cirrhinus molitorella TaxID=172907 RepID=A0AA88PSD4_9TELE|nr:hypothetical protein Q8A67_009579 [Cirrhinus molitorella]